jgi:DNA helicase-2/ATP-dependent DNA helicase PcrA
MPYAPSPQQSTVYRWVREESGNLILVAVAGSGKTTTILNATTMMKGSVALAAYNKKIAVEITNKLQAAGVGRNVQAGTFHSFGLRNWQRAVGQKRVVVDGDKVSKILTTQKCPEDIIPFAAALVSMAKQRAFGVLTPIVDVVGWHDMVSHYDLDQTLPEDKGMGDSCRDEQIENGIFMAQRALRVSLEMDRDIIDFDDMIYAPLAHDARVWQNDWLLVDEAQDTNPARRALAKKMLTPGGRAIFVGDPAQAIYGFTGADNDSLDIIEREFACKRLPLTVTYRCPKAVVAKAQMYVSHIMAADSAPEGEVRSMSADDFHKLPAESFTKDGAMLCRTTAPLVKEAFALIRRGIGCQVEGKDIGRGLVKLASKWQTNSLVVLKDKLDDYRAREVEKFMSKGEERKAEALSDKIDTLLVIMDSLTEDHTVDDLKATIRKIFGDTPDGQTPSVFTLSTVHKSKGREWQVVYLLDRSKLMPSRFARQQWQLEQEMNLIYVAITRSQGTLVEVDS